MVTISQTIKLAVQHHQAGDLESADKLYREILRVDPRHAGVHYNLGNVLQKQNRVDEAIDCFLRALSLDPQDAMCHRALGTALKARGELSRAVECFRTALSFRPSYAEAYNNLGNVLLDQEDFAGAIECYRSAVQTKPVVADFQFNLGNALLRAGRLEEAEESFRHVVALKPDDPDAWNSLGISVFDQGRIADSILCYERALRAEPRHARSHYNLSLAWLSLGDWEHGWREYEWRWHVRREHSAPCDRPRWNGNDLPEITVMLEAEQGLGDTIQFVRFASAAKGKVGRIVMRCQRPLLQLLEAVEGVDEIYASDDPPTSCDAWLPLMSLPALLQTHTTTIPPAPYLTARPALVERWRRDLAAIQGFRIGIQWQGNQANPKDRFRSFPLQNFSALASLENVQLISLQKGFGGEQLKEAQFPVLDLGSRLDENSGAFIETAAVMTCLDLVITTDTSIAHLAGALGVPTWIPLSSVPEWRWLTGREDTPWYPSVRLFRQTRRDDWDEVFSRMRTQLQLVLQMNPINNQG